MPLVDWILERRLDESFPLPPDLPFTSGTALEAGLSRRALARLVTEGLLRQPIRNVYLATHAGDSLALRAASLRLVAPADCVVVDRHAGWLHGAQMVLAPGEHLELRPLSLFRPSGSGRLRNGISRSGERWLREEDIVEIEGLRVTSALRTAWDLGRVRWTDEAITGLDAMFRLAAFDRAEFLAGMDQFKGQRWVRTLRVIGPLADGRSESPPESILRLRCLEAGLPMEPQVEVWRAAELLARLDLGDRELLAGAEYDGAEWHDSPDQLRHDRERRAECIGEGWQIEAFRKEHLFGRGAVVHERLVGLRRAAMGRRGRRIAS